MGNIHIMDEHLANKIAAGEVVEKISSVVKELVENSIDAKSTTIKIELTLSGTKEIRVTDDGIGMDESDALLAFTPHATSKIKTENDLFFINTLGFRGEALPSIASVSDVTLETCNGKTGTIVHIKGGKLIDKSSDTLRDGTIVSVKNIFYNTPARLKFLKSLNAELNGVIALVERLSLSHPHISFSLFNDDKLCLKTSGSGDLLKTIHEIYGYNTSKNMVEIKGSNLDYEIYGYTSNISISKSNKSAMITLVNGRVVSNPYLNKIIHEAYHTFLAENKYPYCVINIETDPTLIDVNVHPTKQDIKFSKMDSLEELLFSLIRDKLNYMDNTYKAYTETPKVKEVVEPKNTYVQSTITFDVKEQTPYYDPITPNETLIETYEDNREEKEIMIHPVGLAMGTYLFANDENNIYMIDIHAANERINYERMLKSLESTKVTTTDLLFPFNIELSTSEYEKIKEYSELISDLGIKYEEFGTNTCRILSHPTWLIEGMEIESVKRIFDLIISLDGKFDRIKFNDRLAATLACKMSVKANTNISFAEQEILLKRLFRCDFPYTCPHGRPTIIKYTKYEMEKLFKRAANE